MILTILKTVSIFNYWTYALILTSKTYSHFYQIHPPFSQSLSQHKCYQPSETNPKCHEK